MFIAHSPHPVKIRIRLVILRLVIFIFIYSKTSRSWYPILFFLIFIGGILMIFIILSSVLPNEKTKKRKLGITPIILIFMIRLELASKDFVRENIANAAKITLDSSNSIAFLIAAIIFYFFSTLKIVCKEERPLRSHFCCKEKLIL